MGWNCILSYCLVLLAVDAGVKTVHAERSLNLSVSRHANEAGVGFEVEENSATAASRSLGKSQLQKSGELSRRRQMLTAQDSATAKCTLVVGRTQHSFAACTSLPGQPGKCMFFWSYNEAASELRVGFSGRNRNGYISWGIPAPSTPGLMQGGTALVIKATKAAKSGAVIEGIVMSGYAAQDQKGPSWLTVSALAAGAHADGTLVGVFTMSMPKPASSYPPKAFPILYAFGPLDKAGNIEIHPYLNGQSGVLDLLHGEIPSAVAPAPAPSPAPPPLPSPPPQGQGSATASSSCALTMGSAVHGFESCAALSGAAGPLKLYWTLHPNNTLSAGISGTNPGGGYIAWGQPPTTGLHMVGGNAIIVRPDGGSLTGATAGDYHLGGYTSDLVTVPSEYPWNVLTIGAARGPGARLSAVFSLQLSAGQLASAAAFPIIYAMGPISAGRLLTHAPSSAAAATLDLRSTSAAGSVAASGLIIGNAKRNGDIPSVHGWLSLLGVGGLLPAAMVTARAFRELAPAWYHVHRVLALLGFVAAVAACATGLHMRPMLGATEELHQVFGLALLVLIVLQVTAIIYRPVPGTEARRYWNWVHHGSGRAMVGLAIANTYVGIHLGQRMRSAERTAMYVVYSLLLAFIGAVWFFKEVFNCFTRRKVVAVGDESVSKPDMKSKTSPSPTAPRGSDWGLRRARRRTAMDTVAIKDGDTAADPKDAAPLEPRSLRVRFSENLFDIYPSNRKKVMPKSDEYSSSAGESSTETSGGETATNTDDSEGEAQAGGWRRRHARPSDRSLATYQRPAQKSRRAAAQLKHPVPALRLTAVEAETETPSSLAVGGRRRTPREEEALQHHIARLAAMKAARLKKEEEAAEAALRLRDELANDQLRRQREVEGAVAARRRRREAEVMSALERVRNASALERRRKDLVEAVEQPAVTGPRPTWLPPLPAACLRPFQAASPQSQAAPLPPSRPAQADRPTAGPALPVSQWPRHYQPPSVVPPARFMPAASAGSQHPPSLPSVQQAAASAGWRGPTGASEGQAAPWKRLWTSDQG